METEVSEIMKDMKILCVFAVVNAGLQVFIYSIGGLI